MLRQKRGISRPAFRSRIVILTPLLDIWFLRIISYKLGGIAARMDVGIAPMDLKRMKMKTKN